MNVNIDLSEFEEFKNKIDKIDTSNLLKDCGVGLAKKYLRSVTDLTPVDTGNLKGEWHVSKVKETSNRIEIDISNSADYAVYVEYGHRTRDHKGWVKGRFMMTKTNEIIQAGAPKYLEYKVKQFLKGSMK